MRWGGGYPLSSAPCRCQDSPHTHTLSHSTSGRRPLWSGPRRGCPLLIRMQGTRRFADISERHFTILFKKGLAEADGPVCVCVCERRRPVIHSYERAATNPSVVSLAEPRGGYLPLWMSVMSPTDSDRGMQSCVFVLKTHKSDKGRTPPLYTHTHTHTDTHIAMHACLKGYFIDLR